MTSFDKQEYWERRKAGLPGQELFNPIGVFHLKPDWPAKEVSAKTIKKGGKRLDKMIDNAEWHKTRFPNLIATEKAERLA